MSKKTYEIYWRENNMYKMYIEAKSKKKALKEVKEYKEHFMCDDPYPTIKVEEM